MLIATPLAEQIAAQRGDRLKVLIVGAGIAGLTFGGMLRRGGLHPVVVDRMPAGDDARVSRWVMPEGVLLGDAAAGFLPTAGIGAGMAMESAWMLGRMLAHADRRTLPPVLAAWERAERPRVESAQANSRMLAKVMFRRGRIIAWLRETVMRMLSVRAALGPIVRLVAARPDPDAVARAALAGPRLARTHDEKPDSA
ncbi:hypothetical protein AB0N64_10090 [Microbacterium sp. NPDC089318]